MSQEWMQRIVALEIGSTPWAEPPADPPIVEWVEGDPVPDLSQLEVEQWFPAVERLGDRARLRAVATVPPDARVPFSMAVNRMAPRGRVAARGLDRPWTVPTAAAMAPAAPRRQVSFRSSPADHARLTRAAQLLGMSAGQFARAAAVAATNKVIAEHGP